MIDFAFPKDNEKEFISLAERLGIKSLCFVYDDKLPEKPSRSKSSLKIYSAVLCDQKNIRRQKKSFTLMRCSSPKDIRPILEQHRPDLILNLESVSRKDFIHHRASGLNQVHASLLTKNDIVAGFSFSSLLNKKPQEKAVLLGRLSQNISFARKYRFPLFIGSFASEPFHLRPYQDLKSFAISLGMHPSEFDFARKTIFKRLETNINE